MACNFCTNGCIKCQPWSNGSRANAALRNFSLTNPIPDECSDPEELKKLFSKKKYIPYAGYSYESQHNYLRFIDNLAKLSPTLGGVINSINFACFGGKTNIKLIGNSDFDLSTPNDKVTTQPDISIELKQRFLDHLLTFDLSGKDWSSLKTQAFKSLKSNGNIYLQVDIIRSLGAHKVKYTLHPTRNVLYKVPDLFADRFVAISKSWDQKYLKEFPPQEIPVYPAYEKTKEGIIRTMIHIKEGENDFYGRPDWESCLHDAYLEIKNKEYLLKAAHNNFTGKVLVEFEGDPANQTATDDEDAKKNGYTGAEQRWVQNFTNQGDDPQSLLIAERPFGAKEAFVHEFNVNMNEKFYESTDKITTNKIILVNGWSKKLLGIEETAGISGNSFIDALKTKLTLIEYYQDTIDNNLLNKASNFVNEMLGKTEFIGIGIESKNPFDHLLNAQEPIKPIDNGINNN